MDMSTRLRGYILPRLLLYTCSSLELTDVLDSTRGSRTFASYWSRTGSAVDGVPIDS
jgi:hypothetical protein